jgi:hypothetical protein
MARVEYFVPDFGGPAGFAHQVYREIMRQGIPSKGAALLTAHMALSTGWGKKAHNYILAGIKAGPRDACYGGSQPTVPYVCLCTFEYSGGKLAEGCSDCATITARDGKPRCKHPFRAYNSLGEGVAGVLSLLRKSRYSSAYQMLVNGDPEYFAEVGRNGWYTAPIATTAAAMQKHLAQVYNYLKMPAPPVPGGMSALGAIAAVGAGYFLLKWWTNRSKRSRRTVKPKYGALSLL